MINTTKHRVEQAEARLVSLYHDTNKYRSDIKLKLDFLKAWEHYIVLKTANEVFAPIHNLDQYNPSKNLPPFRKLINKVRLYEEKYV